MVDLVDLDPRLDKARIESGEDLRRVPLQDDEHKTHIGTSLKPNDNKLVSLIDNTNLFAWTGTDMPEVSPNIITHCLSIYKEVRPIVHKKRKIGEKKRVAARQEAKKFEEVGFIRITHSTTRLANLVMVKKSNGMWRICTNYTSLNKSHPKDYYPLSSIYQLVDEATGHTVMSFLDAYLGYNKIQMHPKDKEKTNFMID